MIKSKEYIKWMENPLNAKEIDETTLDQIMNPEGWQ